MVPGSDYPVVRAARARQEFRRAGTWSRVSDCWDGADEDVTWSGGHGMRGLGEGPWKRPFLSTWMVRLVLWPSTMLKSLREPEDLKEKLSAFQWKIRRPLHIFQAFPQKTRNIGSMAKLKSEARWQEICVSHRGYTKPPVCPPGCIMVRHL